MTAVEAWAAPAQDLPAVPVENAAATFGARSVYAGVIGGLAVCGVAWLAPSPFAIVPATLAAVPVAALFAGGRAGGAVAGLLAAGIAHSAAIGPLVSASPAAIFTIALTKESLGEAIAAMAVAQALGFLGALGSGAATGAIVGSFRPPVATSRILWEPSVFSACWSSGLCSVVVSAGILELAATIGGPIGSAVASATILPAIAAFGMSLAALWWVLRRRWGLLGWAQAIFLLSALLGVVAPLFGAPLLAVVSGGSPPALVGAAVIALIGVLAPLASYRAAREPHPPASHSEAFAGGVLASTVTLLAVWGPGGVGFGLAAGLQAVPFIAGMNGQPQALTLDAATRELLAITTTWVPGYLGLAMITWIPIALLTGVVDRRRRIPD